MDIAELTKIANTLMQKVKDDPGELEHKILATAAIEVGLMVISDLHRAADALVRLADNNDIALTALEQKKGMA